MAEKRYTSFDELPLTLTVPEVAEVLDIGRNTAYEICLLYTSLHHR